MSDSAKDQRKRPASDIPEPKGFKAKIRKLVRRAARPKPKPAQNAENPPEESPSQDSPDGCLGLIGRLFGMIDKFFEFLWNMVIVIFLVSFLIWLLRGCEGEPPEAPRPGTRNHPKPPRRAQVPAMNPHTVPPALVSCNFTPEGR